MSKQKVWDPNQTQRLRVYLETGKLDWRAEIVSLSARVDVLTERIEGLSKLVWGVLVVVLLAVLAGRFVK